MSRKFNRPCLCTETGGINGRFSVDKYINKHRYKFSADSVKKAKSFLQGKANTGPAWASKFKDNLKIKDGKIFYEDKQIVAKEEVDGLLRKEIYKVGGDTPSGIQPSIF